MENDVNVNQIVLTRRDWSEDEKHYRRSVAVLKQIGLLNIIVGLEVSDAVIAPVRVA